MKDLILKVGEDWCQRHEDEFGLQCADKVVDFFNNGGLELRARGLNLALQYASVWGDSLEIGAWSWADDEDFDLQAIFEVYCEDDFTAEEIGRITERIKEIYGTGEN